MKYGRIQKSAQYRYMALGFFFIIAALSIIGLFTLTGWIFTFIGVSSFLLTFPLAFLVGSILGRMAALLQTLYF